MVRLRKQFFITLLCFCLVCSACATSRGVRGVYHRLQKGETLFQIARAYNVSVDDLSIANNIDDPDSLPPDIVLFIPGATAVREVVASKEISAPAPRPNSAPSAPAPEEKSIKLEPKANQQSPQTSRKSAAIKEETLKKPQPQPKKPPTDVKTKKAEPEKRAAVRTGKLQFLWPLDGTVSSPFGRQADGIHSNGITIASKQMASVKASEEGTVIHSAPIKFYGDTIILKHRRDYLTVYANLNESKVKTGDVVGRGETIATLEKQEKTGDYSLYFEVRYKNRPKNPLRYIPKR